MLEEPVVWSCKYSYYDDIDMESEAVTEDFKHEDNIDMSSEVDLKRVR